MRGLELNRHLVEVGARFIREAKTSGCYRLYSIDDAHPAMYRANPGDGNEIRVEIWELEADALASVLMNEPPGLCVGKVELNDGTTVLGVLAEQGLITGQKEITRFGGWREYLDRS